MKTAAVWSGSGFDIFWHAGCALAMEEEGIEIDEHYGISGGGHIAAILSRYTPSEAVKILRTLDSRSDIWSKKFWLGMKGVFSQHPLEHLIKDYLKDKPVIKPATVGMALYQTEEFFFLNTNDVLRNARTGAVTSLPFLENYLGTSAIPAVVEPYKGKWCDGGVVINTPLAEAIRNGADRIYVFCAFPYPPQPADWKASWPYWISFGVQGIKLAIRNNMYKDMEKCERRNEEVRAGSTSFRKIEIVRTAIDPEDEITGTDFNKRLREKSINAGFEDFKFNREYIA